MLFRRKLLSFLSIIILLSTLAACGGSDSDPSATERYLSGTAAKGAAIVGTVTAVDANGVTATATIGTDGSFQVQVTGLVAPFMLQAEPSNGSDPVQYSFAAALGDVANITPLTSLALYLANGNADPASLFNGWGSSASDLTAAIQAQQAIVNANLEAAGLLSGNGLANTFNFFTQEFNANGQGLDAVLDSLTVDLSSGVSVSVSGNSGFNFNVSIDTSGFSIGGGGSTSGGSLPSFVASQIVDMEFCCAVNGAPYMNGEVVKFTFSSSGALMLTDQFTLVSNTFTDNSNATTGIYVWDDGTYKYELSTLNLSIHEVNVSLSSDNTFLGQFSPVTSTPPSASVGISLTVDASTVEFSSGLAAVDEPSNMLAVSGTSASGSSIVFRVPKALGVFTCNINMVGINSVNYTNTTNAGACTGNVTSLNPFNATFSGKIWNLTTFATPEITNGSINLGTAFTVTPE